VGAPNSAMTPSPVYVRLLVVRGEEGARLSTSDAPHLRQNFVLALAAAPHDAQTMSRAAPHASQKDESTGFSVWHVEQRIRLAYGGEKPSVRRTAASTSRSSAGLTEPIRARRRALSIDRI